MIDQVPLQKRKKTRTIAAPTNNQVRTMRTPAAIKGQMTNQAAKEMMTTKVEAAQRTLIAMMKTRRKSPKRARNMLLMMKKRR